MKKSATQEEAAFHQISFWRQRTFFFHLEKKNRKFAAMWIYRITNVNVFYVFHSKNEVLQNFYYVFLMLVKINLKTICNMD